MSNFQDLRHLAADKLLQAISNNSLPAAELLRRLIALMPRNYVFTTRELLPFASRANVDTFLSRMVKTHQLERLANGVFRDKSNSDNDTALSREQILAVKRRAFAGKMARADAAVLSQRYSNTTFSANNTHRFLTDGSSSSFKLMQAKVKLELKRAGRRMLALGESKAGRALRNHWLLGAQKCKREEVETSLSNLSEVELTQVIAMKKIMPQWLTEMLPTKVDTSKTAVISYLQKSLFKLWQIDRPNELPRRVRQYNQCKQPNGLRGNVKDAHEDKWSSNLSTGD